MCRDITQWARECQQCARSKITSQNVSPLEFVLTHPRGQFTHVYADITGPLDLSHAYNYLLVIIHGFSWYMSTVLMVGISAQALVNSFVRPWVSWTGCPQHLFTNRDTQVTSSLWGQTCDFLGCQIHHSTASSSPWVLLAYSITQ